MNSILHDTLEGAEARHEYLDKYCVYNREKRLGDVQRAILSLQSYILYRLDLLVDEDSIKRICKQIHDEVIDK